MRAYDQRLVAIVGDELYEQSSHERAGGLPPQDTSTRLRSTIAWVHVPRLADTVAVRDVVEVDGQPLEERTELQELLRAPAGRLESNVRHLLNRSAAYNLAPGSRNINFPTFPLVYLRQPNVGRSRWRAARDGEQAVLEFEERGRPSIVRSEIGHHLRARGRFWIDDQTGRIDRAQVRLSDGEQLVTAVSFRLDVTFEREARLEMWLPSRMDDVYERTGGDSYLRVEGAASYTNYRRFETDGRVITSPR